MKPILLLDACFWKVAELFSWQDLLQLRSTNWVVWGRNERCPKALWMRYKEGVHFIVTTQWHFDLPTGWPQLRIVVDVGGGALPRLSASLPFHLETASPAFAPMCAESCLALALACCRGVGDSDRRFRTGRELYKMAGNVSNYHLYGQTVGIIGYGSIAACLSRLLEPFHCNILCCDALREGSGGGEQYLHHVRRVALHALLKASRVVFVLATPGDSNYHVIGRRELGLLRRGAVVVVLSRAHLVDFRALREAVVHGLCKVAIDVFPSEPYPLLGNLRTCHNAILTPHTAGTLPAGSLSLHGIGRSIAASVTERKASCLFLMRHAC